MPSSGPSMGSARGAGIGGNANAQFGVAEGVPCATVVAAREGVALACAMGDTPDDGVFDDAGGVPVGARVGEAARVGATVGVEVRTADVDGVAERLVKKSNASPAPKMTSAPTTVMPRQAMIVFCVLGERLLVVEFPGRGI